MTTSKTYDNLNRLTQISSVGGTGSTPSEYVYSYNNANQRTSALLADGSYWLYTYDKLGQVTGGKKYWSDGTPVAGQQFEYTDDDIGNRTQTKTGGDQSGANLRTANYTNNSLNQITSRYVPGTNDIIGLALATNGVTVNGLSAYRRGEYFQEAVGTNNTSSAYWFGVTVSSGSSSSSGNIFISQTPEVFVYDADGNMATNGRWILTWDAENRLTKVESLSSSPTASKRKVTWEFDGKGRRIRQTTYDGSSGSYIVTEDLKFLSDGWRHIAELNATNNAMIRSYVWGTDLSGTFDGDGGVGGLLMLDSVANGVHFYAYDGNGNVAGLVKGSDGTVSENCEYDPFGKIIRNTGLMADENRFLFSTKRSDRTTDFELYEDRVRHPDLTWLSRDPIGEVGGLSLYAFCQNDALNYQDALGLWKTGDHELLTELSFRAAWDIIGIADSTCEQKMLRRITGANVGQDTWHSGDMRRHYNRRVRQRTDDQKRQADEDYGLYVDLEVRTFDAFLSVDASAGTCRQALNALGRVTHSWQDFFAHAIRRDGKGRKEPGSPSSAEGWIAWSAGVTGTPGNRNNFWPSSYRLLGGGGEHPPTQEPIVHDGAEYWARYRGAQDYVEQQFRSYVHDWLQKCKCFCNEM